MQSSVKYTHDKTLQSHHLFFIIAIVLAVTFSQVAMADEVNEKASPEEGSHEFHRHHMALILGNIQNDESKDGLSVGIDYEYRINKWQVSGLLRNIRVVISSICCS
jgi:hypothetical protein